MSLKRKIRVKLSLPARFKFIQVVLLLMTLSFLVHGYLSLRLFEISASRHDAAYLIFQLNYIGIMAILIITLVWILHYGFGALSRMENILEQIIRGDYTFRMHLRTRDIMRPFAEKLNKILDQLEECKRKG